MAWSRGEGRIIQDREATAMSQAAYSREAYADAELVAQLRGGRRGRGFPAGEAVVTYHAPRGAVIR